MLLGLAAGSTLRTADGIIAWFWIILWVKAELPTPGLQGTPKGVTSTQLMRGLQRVRAGPSGYAAGAPKRQPPPTPDDCKLGQEIHRLRGKSRCECVYVCVQICVCVNVLVCMCERVCMNVHVYV